MSWRRLVFSGPLRLPLAVAALYFIVSQLLRIALVAHFHPESAPAGDYAKLFAAGLHVDAVVALAIATPFAAWCLLKKKPFQRTGRRWLTGALAAAWGLFVFLFISEWYFFEEFQSRFNTVAIDYLIYPHEVFTNLWESYPLPAIFAVVVAGAAGLTWLSLRLGPPHANERRSRLARWGGVLGWLAVVAALAFTIRPAETAFSTERVVNELASNGLASGTRAAWTRNLDYAAFYPSMDRREAFLAAREALAGPEATFLFPEPPAAPVPDAKGELDPIANDAWLQLASASLQRRIAGDPAKPRLNVCVLVQESLGSEFWGSLGRKKKSGKRDTLLPLMDELAEKEALLFDNIYADGNRTIRGLEAVFSSFPPLPGDSILARDKTENVETLARVLKRDGYQTLFVYGGRGTFDYISSYALRNGWDRLIQQWDFDKPTHTTAWGVCDEDAYNRMLQEMRTMHASGQPFLICNMSLTNHPPFSFPAGRVEEDPNAESRKHALRYCDWALHDFFTKAKNEPFWQDTVFVLVADHGARVYGSQTIPLKSYEIPFLVLGPAAVKEPRRINTLGCQLDVTPTLLGLIGRPYDSMFFGKDLLRQTDPAKSRCLMHHNRSIAIYRDQMQVVFGLNKSIEYWQGDPKIPAMQKISAPDDAARALEHEGTALFQVADELYIHRKYRLQEPPPAR